MTFWRFPGECHSSGSELSTFACCSQQVFLSASVSSPHVMCAETPSHMPEPPRLSILDEEETRLADSLEWAPPDFWNWAQSSSRGSLYPGSRSFKHYPCLMTTGKGWNVDGPVNWELHPLTQLLLHHNRTGQHPHQCRWGANASIHLPLLQAITHETRHRYSLAIRLLLDIHSAWGNLNQYFIDELSVSTVRKV